jgi:hypothetical protein
MEKCYVPGDLDDARNATRSAIGDVVELFINRHYCNTLRNPCFRFDPVAGIGPQTDFFDAFRGPHRCNDITEYLNKHYSIDTKKLSDRCLQGKKGGRGRFPVPDIITYIDDDWGEYYEIKPNSPSGKRAGLDKIKWFNDGPPGEPTQTTGIVKEFGLRHHKGTKFVGKKEKVWNGRWGSTPYDVSLEYWLDKDNPGLILYQFCLELDVEFVAELFALLVWAALAGLLLKLGTTMQLPESLVQDWVPLSMSPLRGSVGRDADNDFHDLMYVQLVYNQYHVQTFGSVGTGVEFSGCHPPFSDDEGAHIGDCLPDTMPLILGLSPGGKFTPTDPGWRKVEAGALLLTVDGVTEDSAALMTENARGEVTDEEGDDPVADSITPTTIATETIQGYLDAFFKLSQLPFTGSDGGGSDGGGSDGGGSDGGIA